MDKKLKLDKYKDILLISKALEKSEFDNLKYSNKNKVDLIIAYVYSLKDMKNILLECYKKEILNIEGQIYLLYPKNKNKLKHNPIHRDDILPYLNVDENGYVENTSYKFNKMLSLNENYTLLGLKYLSKEKLNKNKAKLMCVDDYIDKIKDVENFLKNYPNEEIFFNSLSFGYKKDWARYIYSAKTIETINKRQKEMVEILSKGYKSKNLYKTSSKGEV